MKPLGFELPERPLVSCMCLTMPGREEFLKIAVDCYEKQTYPYRELILISGNGYLHSKTSPYSPTGFVWVKADGQSYPLGDKRNAAVRMANGQVIVHWDDDDYSDPGRIEDQLEALRMYRKAVFGYRSMDFLDLTTGLWHHIGKGRSDIEPFGTSLCYLRSWALAHPFPSLQVQEDVEFIRVAAQHNEVCSEDGFWMMYATAHPGNTSPRTNMARFPVVPPERWLDAPHIALVNARA